MRMPERDGRRVDMKRRDTHDVPRKDFAPTVIKAMMMSVGERGREERGGCCCCCCVRIYAGGRVERKGKRE